MKLHSIAVLTISFAVGCSGEHGTQATTGVQTSSSQPPRSVPLPRYVNGLLALATNPKAAPRLHEEKGERMDSFVYKFAGLDNANLAVLKSTPSAWRWRISPAPPEAFAPAGATRAVPQARGEGPSSVAWRVIESGPLAGRFLQHVAGSSEVVIASSAWVQGYPANDLRN